MSEGNLDFLRTILLFCDGIATLGCVHQMLFYRRLKEELGLYRIYVFFTVMTAVYLVTTLSDLAVVLDLSYWWTRTPIVRGLVLRVPIGIVLYWMMLRKVTGKPGEMQG